MASIGLLADSSTGGLPQMRFAQIDYDDAYADETVAMWKASKEKALGFNDAPERYLKYLRTGLIVTNKVYLALDADTNKVVGLMATDGHELNQLYIDPSYQRMGIGGQLLDLAKQLSSGRLGTRTFEVNAAAQAFYAKHGFSAIGRDYNECRKLVELIYEWTAPQLGCQTR
jgi:ribosomal protein S18 acetylase RimI-like enzyme